jgi:hypothetical protein
MDDERLIALFEAGEEPPDGFHHADHVHVAWWYLCHHALPVALTRFSASLKRFALARGKPQLFHETITIAYLLLINERLDDIGRDVSWEAFAARSPDLLTYRPSVLDRYYYAETLSSDRARRTFVMPDRLAMPVAHGITGD